MTTAVSLAVMPEGAGDDGDGEPADAAARERVEREERGAGGEELGALHHVGDGGGVQRVEGPKRSGGEGRRFAV
jgi:hypothetical protein